MRASSIITVMSLAVLLFSAGCGSSPYFEEYQSIEGNTWNYREPAVFEMDVDDTVSAFDFYLNLRTTKSYEFSNIYVFFLTDFPDGHHTRDTIEAILAGPDGTWLGKTTGGLVENKILFRKNKKFPMTGAYTFRIEQAMRGEELNEVADVGIRIEKSKR